MPEFTFERMVKISWEGMSRPWITSKVKDVEGMSFVKISKSDTGFVRWVAGETLSGSSRALTGQSCLSKLRHARNFTMANMPRTLDGAFKKASRNTVGRKFAKSNKAAGESNVIKVRFPAVSFPNEPDVGPTETYMLRAQVMMISVITTITQTERA